jgi:hypothetical protein
MYKYLPLGCLFALLTMGMAVAAEQKPLKQEDLLQLRNHELSLQNLELRIELLSRERDKLRYERDSFVEGLFKNYEVNQEWKIDLQKGIWFLDPKGVKESLPKTE